tara:strand:+ start:722 stop:1096 length:375 start_codon:yes stop_codon:yes gene_type:complete
MKSKSKGLGDTIQKITEATGVEKVVKKFFGEDCGCDKRRDRLNKMFPYRQIKEMTEEQYNFFKDVLQPAYRGHKNLKGENSKYFYKMYNDIFGKNMKITKCTSCNKNMYIELLKVFEAQCTNDE